MLDKWTGKKCYMLSARDLAIVWSDTPDYWRWVPDPGSRFPPPLSLSLPLCVLLLPSIFVISETAANRFAEVAELIGVCWLEINGRINTQMLSPATMYTAYLVFKLATGASGFRSQNAEVSVGLAGSTFGFKRSVLLDARIGRGRNLLLDNWFGSKAYVPVGGGDGRYPEVRKDGWLEIKLGEFLNKESEDGELEMSITEVKGGHWKHGLVVQGIEIRPKIE